VPLKEIPVPRILRRFAPSFVGLALLAAGQPAPAAAPTSAPAKPAAPASSPAAAVPSPVTAASPATLASPSPSPAAASIVFGPIDAMAGRVLTVTTNTGPKQVQVPESARVEQEGKGVPADLRPGLSVAITSSPDGTAKSIRIFAAALGTPRPGQFPMTGAQQGSLMTNAVIESFDGRMLSVAATGQRWQITVPPDTEVLRPFPATYTDLAAGKRVAAAGTLAPDGVLLASSVIIQTGS
jgi:hypothetical protein